MPEDEISKTQLLLWISELRQEVALTKQTGEWTQAELLRVRARLWAVALLLVGELALPALQQFLGS